MNGIIIFIIICDIAFAGQNFYNVCIIDSIINNGSFYNISYENNTYNFSSKMNISGGSFYGNVDFEENQILNLTSIKLSDSLNHYKIYQYVSSYIDLGYNISSLWFQQDDLSSKDNADMNINFYNPSTSGGVFYNFISSNKWIGIDLRPEGSLNWRLGMEGNDDFIIHRYGGSGNLVITDSNIKIVSQAGSGYDYACFDDEGIVFRSTIDCHSI